MTSTPELIIPLQEAVILAGRDHTTYLDMAATLEGIRIEYIEGDIILTPASGTQHQRIARNLIVLLDSLGRFHLPGEVFGAPLYVQLAPEATIVQPDVIFVRQARIEAIVREQRILGAPDLVAEILSPSTARIDRAIKLQTYARYGVSEYWIVNPVDTTVEIYMLREEGYLVAGVYTPGDTIDAGLFAEAKIAVNAVFGLKELNEESGKTRKNSDSATSQSASAPSLHRE
jgi:Uma2 family endonuclease